MRNPLSIVILVALAVLFLGLNLIGSQALKGLRIDLTEDRLYTLSEGTRNLLGRLEEPINLTLYFSEETSRDLPMIRSYADRVDELLQEMEDRSDGMLRVNRVDPRPFSEEEDEAERLGLQAVPIGSGEDTIIFGVAGTNAVDGLEVIPFLQPDQESFLEYELARIIQILNQPEPPRVGLVSGLPMGGGNVPGQGEEPWAVYDQIEQFFHLEDIDPGAEALPAGLDALVLVHPAGMSDELVEQIDRFALEGGRLLIFVDPWAEAAAAGDPMDPMGDAELTRDSSLPALFGAWGIDFDPGHVVADLEQALQVAMQPGQPPVRHPAILGVGSSYLNSDDVVTADLSSVNLSSAGALSRITDAPVEFTPLIESSSNSGLIPAERLQGLVDPGPLLSEVEPVGSRHVLAARLTGTVPTAFPDRAGENGHPESGDLNAIVVGDTDLLSDHFWVQRQNLFGEELINPFAGNGDFVINAIDNLLGDADLIQVRSRGVAQRPFDRVERLRREAERNLRSTQDALEAELQETEQRLTEFQQARGETDLAVLTPEQEAEIDNFLERRTEIRQELRQVRRDLDREIESLGTRLKLLNIAAVPAVVTLLALVLAWRRRRRPREVRS